LAQTERLSAALAGDDAFRVDDLQDGFTVAVRRVETSSVMLPQTDQDAITPVLQLAREINERLTELRLRFGGQAGTVAGSLAQVSLHASDGELDGYTNIEELLIDVRTARELVATLRAGQFPPLGVGFNSPNNLDPLQVRRLHQRAWELERSLSTQIVDVSQTLPEWEAFIQEYSRLDYMGTGSNVRQLERVVARLEDFYSRRAGF
jgi:hypothetical protein